MPDPTGVGRQAGIELAGQLKKTASRVLGFGLALVWTNLFDQLSN